MTTAQTSSTEWIVRLLRDIDGFSALEPEALAQMAEVADYRDVARGDVLIKEGDPASNLFIVLKGRFVVLSGDTPIAEIAMGEPIGELAFFAGGTRTASVVAARNSSVMCLSRSAYDTLAAKTPALSNGILAALSQRLARTISSSPELRPKAGKVCTVFPGLASTLSPDFSDGLRAAFAKVDDWQMLDEDDCPEAIRADASLLTKWLEGKEAEHGNLVLLCKAPEQVPVWRAVTADTSDTIFIAAPNDAVGGTDDAVAPSALERELLTATLRSNIQLALYRSRAGQPTTGTARWLKDRDVALHHHLALDEPEDFDRLGRFVRGEAVGLVLCGGGSFGTAHLGAIKAMLERGYRFDFVGGTSVGSAMGAALAIGLDPGRAIDLCEDVFIRSKAMSRLTVPRHAVLDHHRLDAALRKHFGAFNVEDTPINFFAIATSLTDNDVRRLRRGPLWQSVRASTSLPGVFPPFLTEEGEVLIDGGLLDNVPVNIMRDLKPGPNVILNFLAGRPWRVRALYEDLPTRRQAVLGLFRRRKRGVARHPSVLSILSRSMVVNSRKLLEQTDIGNDILINIPTLRGMSFLDWARGRELFNAAYGQASEALDAAALPDNATEHARFERLRQAAQTINATTTT